MKETSVEIVHHVKMILSKGSFSTRPWKALTMKEISQVPWMRRERIQMARAQLGEGRPRARQ